MDQPSFEVCGPSTAERFQGDALSRPMQRAYELHLEECADCRATLESMAGDPDWWDEARNALSGELFETSVSDVEVRRVDLSTELQVLSFYLHRRTSGV